jgi:hypothetical protein
MILFAYIVQLNMQIMKTAKPRLSLTQSEYEKIVEFVAKKFAFDEMFLNEATTQEDIQNIKGRLSESEILFKKLKSHPHYLTENTAKWVVSYLMEAQQAYKFSIQILKQLGDNNVGEMEEELRKAEEIHEKLNEFLIDCIQD